MRNTFSRVAAVVAAAAALGGCTDFLTSGGAATDPNRPTQATAVQRFVGVQTGLWAYLGSDPLRITSLLTQQLGSTGAAYDALANSYSVSENTTNGFFTAIYTGGGLIDIRRVQSDAAALGDSTLLGIAQVQEGLLMGTAADLFGRVVYSQAYSGQAPQLDSQLAVYDSVQAVLSRAITNLAATGPTNIGPRAADLTYGGNRQQWTRLARTLKARFYLHTAKVNANAYTLALPQAQQGILSAADDYQAVFSGAANEQNLNYQFNVVQRGGQIGPGPFLYTLMEQRGDPRLATYFPDSTTLGDAFTTANAPQVFVSANENLLIIAESAYRTGNLGLALSSLNQEQTLAGVPLTPAATTGLDLLREILTEKYITLFPNIEVYNDYRRNCFPNLPPLANGRKIPARLLYDANERQTNPNIPAATDQPARNEADPASQTDPFGNVCLGQ